MVPCEPTAHPRVALTNWTRVKWLEVPLAWLTQVAPPSVVRRIVPLGPTAQPLLASAKNTPCRSVLVPLSSAIQPCELGEFTTMLTEPEFVVAPPLSVAIARRVKVPAGTFDQTK